MPRRSKIERNTAETQISLSLEIEGTGNSGHATPVPFLNHMLDAFTRHGMFNITTQASGDTEIDAHHTVEDVGLCLGMAFADALGDRTGIRRYGWATIPMDDTLVTCAVDFCGRPAFAWRADALKRRWVGSFDCDLAKEFWAAFSTRAKCNVHVLVHYGENAHHILEAIFKACARACDAATLIDERLADQVPSTKGTLVE